MSHVKRIEEERAHPVFAFMVGAALSTMLAATVGLWAIESKRTI